MKNYLLTQDQIERMLACAIELTAEPDLKGMQSRLLSDRLKNPKRRAHKNGIEMFKQLRNIDIILPIETN